MLCKCMHTLVCAFTPDKGAEANKLQTEILKRPHYFWNPLLYEGDWDILLDHSLRSLRVG